MGQARLRRKAFGQPLDKTKDAFIGTLANKGGGLFTKEHTQIFIESLADMYFILILLALKANSQFFIGNIEAVIYQVTNNISIDRANKIAGLETCAVGRAFRYYLTHPSIHFW